MQRRSDLSNGVGIERQIVIGRKARTQYLSRFVQMAQVSRAISLADSALTFRIDWAKFFCKSSVLDIDAPI